MRDLRKKAVIVLSVIAVLAAVLGVYRAIHSPLFTVQVVEVTDQVSASEAAPTPAGTRAWEPVDAQTISNLAAVPVGQANLFDLDLARVEKRILANPWIRAVRLEKHFPQTLSITAIFRQPKAIVQLKNGTLAYVDDTGKVFGRVNLAGPRDLALITDVDSENGPLLKDLLQLLSQWRAMPVARLARVESLTFDQQRGYRLMVSYTLNDHLVHTRVDLGSGISPAGQPEDRGRQLTHLAQVFRYLRGHSVVARQISADAGKKIVVKTAHGS